MTGFTSPDAMVLQRKPRAVIFDFDLTLVESTEGVAHCVNYALGTLGLPQVTTEQ